MKSFALLLLLVVGVAAVGQTDDHLSPEEVGTAMASKAVGSAFIIDMSVPFGEPNRCNSQFASETIYSPAGWLRAVAANAQKQYLPFAPTPDDILRAFTVVSEGCAGGGPSGPHCDSITRVVLLSDKNANKAVEALESYPMASTWQNGYGATASCTSLVSKFRIGDIQRVRNAKGEFVVVTFSGSILLKRYVVKEKFAKRIGWF